MFKYYKQATRSSFIYQSTIVKIIDLHDTF